VLHELVEWESFYVIVGSSAGALIGLQFVVLTLLAEKPQTREPGRRRGVPRLRQDAKREGTLGPFR